MRPSPQKWLRASPSLPQPTVTQLGESPWITPEVIGEGPGREFVNGWVRTRLKGKRQGWRGQGEWKVVLGTSLRLPICWFLVANPHSFKCTIYPQSNYLIWPMLELISALNRIIPYPPMMIASSIVLMFDYFLHHNIKVECIMQSPQIFKFGEVEVGFRWSLFGKWRHNILFEKWKGTSDIPLIWWKIISNVENTLWPI